MPRNTNGTRMTKNSATMSNELTEVKTQPPKDPGEFDKDQAKLSQLIDGHNYFYYYLYPSCTRYIAVVNPAWVGDSRRL